jgi:hypothetical protein
VARGRAPDAPREEIRFDSATGNVLHDPNRAVAGDEQVIFRAGNQAKAQRVCFFPSVKTDGSVDTTLLNIWIEVNDNQTARRQDAAGSLTNLTTQRSFTVKMRNA